MGRVQGEPDEGQAAVAVAAAPLREAAHLLRIRALAAGGDRAGALDAYVRLRERLADELGIDPSPEVRRVYRELLGAPTPSRAASPLARGEHWPFEGRNRELATLRRAHGIALVAGQPGAGKSRLLAELARQVTGTVISGRAVLPEREHPLSLARTLLRAVIHT
ncbi:MAG: hypothetical protein GEV04_18980, partial [Actinophytocola sp.]|nr:hypothetical protein [Actinophytocola sp.]